MVTKILRDNLSKIVATIGPASSSTSVIVEMLQAGMDVARLNFSHGTHQEHAKYLGALRQAAAEVRKPLAVMQDLPGSKNRTGKLKESQVELKTGAKFILTTKEILGDEHRVSVGLPSLVQEVTTGAIIFLGDGAIKLEVIATEGSDIKCQVMAGGFLGEDKGINAPGVVFRAPSFTEEDRRHLLFGLKQQVDFIAISFVRQASDILEVRRFLHQKGGEISLIAKIERQEAVANIDEILEVADGVMIARGDLGLEIPIEKVPIVQKEIVHKCNRLGKPVIVATQMLESMVRTPLPTRAEVTDVANAVIDGADALMLSEETAIGKYPVAAIKMMARIALEAEATIPYQQLLVKKGRDLPSATDDAISYAACHIAHQLSAAAIIAATSSGSTVQRVAKYRPKVPIVAITPSEAVQRKLCLFWGVCAYEIVEPLPLSDLFIQGAKIAKEKGIARSGDLVVITGGIPIGIPGTTNLLKVERVK